VEARGRARERDWWQAHERKRHRCPRGREHRRRERHAGAERRTLPLCSLRATAGAGARPIVAQRRPGARLPGRGGSARGQRARR
jgi:hypothetical protein